MTQQEIFWTLEDYQRFLQHPEYIVRDWAAERIERQYKEQAAECLVPLLQDEKEELQIKAVRAMGQSGEAKYEPLLLDALSASENKPELHAWLLEALARLRSATVLPHFVQTIKRESGYQPVKLNHIFLLHIKC